MKITLLHGDAIVKSRERFSKIIEKTKEKGYEVVEIENFSESLTSQSLFNDKVLFVAEKPKLINLEKVTQDYNLLIWLDKVATAKILKSLPKEANVEKFDLPRIIFKFLDSFYPGNASLCIKLLNELSTTQPIELVFSMLGTHLRDMVMLPENPSWRKGKLTTQANKFGPEKIKQIINEMAEIDVNAKTSDISLKANLDLLIIKNLE